jgi:muramoyltetrapeptide carboxypeptidase
MDPILPPRLHPGDRVRVVAPSGPVHRGRFECGVELLGGRYELVFDERELYAREGFLAGSDDHRLGALNAAIRDPGCRAIFMARGGYGLTRILAGVDLGALAVDPKPIVGFSDITALHAFCAGAGIVSIHGPVVAQLGDLPPRDLESMIDLLEVPGPRTLLTGLEELVPGEATGRLIGGNLEVLSRLLGTPEMPDLDGAILFLEDVGEQPYRLDRLFTHFAAAGVFDCVGGVVIGDCVDCDELEDGRPIPPTGREVIVERLAGLGIPVALGGAFGHGERNVSLPHGAPARLITASGELHAETGAVL